VLGQAGGKFGVALGEAGPAAQPPAVDLDLDLDLDQYAAGPACDGKDRSHLPVTDLAGTLNHRG
jgi:hypothetical protein